MGYPQARRLTGCALHCWLSARSRSHRALAALPSLRWLAGAPEGIHSLRKQLLRRQRAYARPIPAVLLAPAPGLWPGTHPLTWLRSGRSNSVISMVGGASAVQQRRSVGLRPGMHRPLTAWAGCCSTAPLQELLLERSKPTHRVRCPWERLVAGKGSAAKRRSGRGRRRAAIRQRSSLGIGQLAAALPGRPA